MKLALCNEVIADRSFEAQCAFARALGYDGLEIAPFTLGDDPRAIGADDIRRYRKVLSDHELEATGLHWLLIKPEGLSITSPDNAVRQATVEVLTRNVEICAELGGSVLVHGSPKQRLVGGDRSAADRAVDMFAHIAGVAESAGVVYCLEPLYRGETDFVNRIEEAVRIVEKIGSPAFRTMIDTSAAGLSEDEPVDELIRKWTPSGHIAHIQFNDRNRRAPGQGDDDFAPILQALADVGYDGVIAMEPFIYEPDRSACAAYAVAYVRGILDASRQ